MPFVNSYEFKGASRFRKTIPAVAADRNGIAATCLAIGSEGDAGLAALIGVGGEILWSRNYSLAGQALGFHDGVAAEGGYLLLSALNQPTGGSQTYLIIRIDQSGNPAWARTIGTDRTRFAQRLIRQPGPPEEFLLIGWANELSAAVPVNAAELIRLDAGGKVLRSAHLRIGIGNKILDAISNQGGYWLIGDPAYPNGATGFVVDIDSELHVRSSWLLTGNPFQPVAALGFPNRLVLTGRSAVGAGVAEMQGSIVEVGTGPTPALRASRFSLERGLGLPKRIAAIGNDILVFNQSAAFQRPQTVLRFNTDLVPLAYYGFDFPDGGAQLENLDVSGSDTVLIGGALTAFERPSKALLIATAASLDCCRTTRLTPPALTRFALQQQNVTATVTDLRSTNVPVKIVATGSGATVISLCNAIETQGEQMVQSPHLALQAAGSMGIDAARGILLRWHLLGALKSHLPKGALAGTTVGFNKTDDFVTIYRAPWPGNAVAARRVSFNSDKPTYVDDANNLLVFETGSGTPRDLFHVRFLDPAAYASARAAANPAQNMAGFLAGYGTNPIEVELRNRLAVACDLDLAPTSATYTVRVETLSVAENRPSANKVLTSRHVLGAADGPHPRLIAENMRSVRIACAGAQINSIAFRCYDDVLAYLNQTQQWTRIGRFALTLDEATVYLRLEDPARTPVDGHWWKFNDGAFVNVSNYRSRWNSPNGGLAAVAQQYVALSEQDPQAIANVKGQKQPDDGEISVSYLDLLQLASLDYHVARMSGLGHIDTGVIETTSYVYMAEYITLGDLADGRGARQVQHLFMALPTDLTQSRPPLVPDLDAVEYGLSVPTANGPPYALTDANGYTPDGIARYIRLYPDCRYLYDADQNVSFFATSDLFDFAKQTLPTLYGVEYRRAGETAWHKPEIAHDDAYVDSAGVAESMPTPFPPKRREFAFIHKETEAGIHEYAAYGVNIFSRASGLSIVRATDATQFRKPNRLLPPSDVRVQLVQTEAPLVLTTKPEQTELQHLLASSADPTLVRLTCNYAHVQEMNYEFADTIELLFRPTAPSNVIGGVKSVSATNDPSVIRIETEPYTYLSTLQTVEPVLPSGQKMNFVGGVLVAGDGRYVVTDISWPDATTGKNPVFLVRTNTSPGVVESDAGNSLVIADRALSIAPQSLMMAIENMAAAASWGTNNPLAAKIRIGDSSWQTRIESFTRSDGTLVSRKLRGVWATATVALANNQYEIIFDKYTLDAHPQASAADPVTWHKGIVRVPVKGLPMDDRRALTVLQITQSKDGKMMLIAVDDSAEAGAVLQGAGILVNYYPGYKIYIHADAAHGFDSIALLPGEGEGSRTTLIAARAVDNSTFDEFNQPYRSLPGVPQPLLAIEIVEPQTPQKPAGLKYATPPDADNKSSFTLTVKFAPGHKPFAAAFYRADAFSILRAIYRPETFAAVRDVIFPPDKNPYFANQFEDLFSFIDIGNVALTPSPFSMPDGSTYTLPDADAPALGLTPMMSLAERKAVIKAAVLRAFLPLTRQPLIYGLIRDDPNYAPSNKPQTFRDANGDLLAPGVPPFDLAPMAKRSETGGVHAIQFTDFTLDGSMSPNTVYFYFAREIGNRMQLGEPSPFFGPVKLVNLSPPSAPRLRKLLTVPYDPTTMRNPQVRFEVVAPSDTDPISKMLIYRAGGALDALSLRTMAKVREIDLATLTPTADGTFVVADDFSGDPIVPYGEPLFYRLVWVRQVAYDDVDGAPKIASAISDPTKMLLASLIDVVNPTAPVPTLQLLSTTAGGDKLVRLNWNKTVHNGTYYVSRLSSFGNWTRLGMVKTNDGSVLFDLPSALPVNDNEGNKIYYRFKVDVENSSGLLNLVAAPITASLESI